MKKLTTQFSTLQKGRSSIVSAGCSSCCCCCCVATAAVFSLATSRYLYLKTVAYNGSPGAVPISPIAYAVYGLLSYAMAVLLATAVASLTGSGEAAIIIGALLYLIISGVVFQRINLHPLLPVLLLAGFAMIAVGEAFIWLSVILH